MPFTAGRMSRLNSMGATAGHRAVRLFKLPVGITDWLAGLGSCPKPSLPEPEHQKHKMLGEIGFACIPDSELALWSRCSKAEVKSFGVVYMRTWYARLCKSRCHRNFARAMHEKCSRRPGLKDCWQFCPLPQLGQDCKIV